MSQSDFCPCCGREKVEKFDICSICGWENDPLQMQKPSYCGGANKMSLHEAQEAFRKGKTVK